MKRLVLFFIWSFLLLIAALHLFAPVTYPNSVAPALLFVVPSILLWTAAALTVRNGTFSLALTEQGYNRTIRLLVFLFCVFTVLAYVEFFLISRRSLFTIIADREAANLAGRSNSVLRGLIALLSATPVVLLTLRYIYAFTNGLKKRLYVDISIAVISIPPLLFSGGRNPIVLAALFLVVVRLICATRFPVAKPHLWFRRLLERTVLIAGSVTLIWYVLYIAIARRILQGTLDNYYLVLASYSLDTTEVFDFLFMRDTGLAVGLTNLYYYLTHGIYRLGEMPLHEWSTTGGFASFPLYVAILNFAFSGNFLSEFESRLIFPGSYTTFWGSLYQDGHALGVLLGVLTVFVLLVYLLRRTRYTLTEFLLLSFLMLSVWVAPIYSVLSSAFGGSLLFVCLMVGIVSRVRLTWR